MDECLTEDSTSAIDSYSLSKLDSPFWNISKKIFEKSEHILDYTSIPFAANVSVENSKNLVSKVLLVGLALLLVVATAGGNLLVLIAFSSEKHLRTITNYFICSLAAADLSVCNSF